MVLLFVQVLAQAVYRTFPVVQALPARAACMILLAVRISVQMACLFSTIATIFSFSASVPESIQAVLMLSKLLLLPVQVLAQVVCMASALLPFAQAVYTASAVVLLVADTPPQALDNSAVLYD